MTDAQEPTITATATAAAPVADAVIPAVDTTTPVVADAKPVEVAPEPVKAETTVEPAKVETPVPPVTESILGDETPKAEEKKDAAESKAVETRVEAPKVELPTYEEFKLPEGLPEGVKIDKEPLDAFSKILGEIETGKLDHAGMQSAGQKLIDLAARNTTESINRLNDYYVGVHEANKKTWFENAKKDPELGNGDEKAFAEIAGNLRTSIDTFAGNTDQQKEFRTLMKDTGVGNHPALLRMLNNMQKKIDSYTKETSNRSVPAQAPAPSKVKNYEVLYQGNKR